MKIFIKKCSFLLSLVHSVERNCSALISHRHWAVSTADGIYLTMRQEPTMALIEPILNGDELQLMAPGMEPISIPLCPDATNNNVSKIT